MRALRSCVGLVLLASISGVFLSAPSAFGAEGDGGNPPPVCSGCSAKCTAATCGQTLSGTDSCGVSCTVTCSACPGPPPPPPPPPPPACKPGPCVGPSVCGGGYTGWNGCSSCYVSGPPRGTCSVSSANCTGDKCDQRLSGTDNCGNCYVDCPACSLDPYGFILPGDPRYGFTYPKPETRDLVGLAAKGNIIIGDYTSNDFKKKVLPHLTPKKTGNPQGKTQPYIIDPTDAPLGYHDAGFMTGLDGKNRPKFSGNYDQQDQAKGLPAVKRNLDGTEAVDEEGAAIPRKFYESTLPDTEFKKILDTNRNGLIDQADDAIFNTAAVAKIDAVLFTNHALAGKVYANRLDLDGSLIARDDALIFGNQLVINHDQRLVNSQINQVVALPFTITRPRLVGVQECPPSGCAALP